MSTHKLAQALREILNHEDFSLDAKVVDRARAALAYAEKAEPASTVFGYMDQQVQQQMKGFYEAFSLQPPGSEKAEGQFSAVNPDDYQKGWNDCRDSLKQAEGQAVPVAFVHWPLSGGPRLVWHSNAALHAAILKAGGGPQPDLLLYAAPSHPAPVTRDQIRAVFMAEGFTIKEGQTDLKEYVYRAAEKLLALAHPAPSRGTGE